MKGLILTYLLTYGGAVAALRYPLIGLHVYVGLAILRPQFIFGFAGDLSGLSTVVGLAVVIGWALNGFGSWRMGRAWPVVVAFSVFLGWYLLSSALALEPDPAFASIWELAKFFVPLYVGVTMIQGEKDWRPLLWTIVLTQGYVGFEMNNDYLFKGYNFAAEGFGGMDNNCFGASLITVFGPALALMLSSNRWPQRILAGASAALILHTILLTFSRGAMVGLIAVGLVGFVMIPKRPKHLGALLLTVMVTLSFTGPELYERYSSTFVSAEERDASAESRVDLWRDCLLVVAEFPFFGVGPTNWRVIAARYGWPEGKSAHSVWMETAAEVGIPGALALLSFFGLAAIRLWPLARARVTEENLYEVILASGVVLAIVGFCVAGQFVSVPGLEVPYYVVMLGAAMLKTAPKRAPAPAPAAVPAKAAGRAILAPPLPAALRPLRTTRTLR